MKEWHYVDPSAARQGPVDDETLLRMNREALLDARTLVWREGLAEWAPFLSVAGEFFESDEKGLPPDLGVCAHSGKVCLRSEMLPYGDALISSDHKDAFVSKLMETGTVGVADATGSPLIYVGFWMRVLASFLDYFVKMPVSWIFMVPYSVLAFTMGTQADGDGGRAVAIANLAYGFGLLGMLAVSIFYDTWMVGRFQATLGKMAIGAKVVKPDGARLNYKQAFYRWFANKVVSYFIVTVPPLLVFAIVMFASFYALSADNPALFAGGMLVAVLAYLVFTLICCGVYWMAAFDPEKRALHDRMAATRVARK